jgi:hypothetical protein
MFSFTEYRGQSSLDKHGKVEIQSDFFRLKRPAWLVALKLVGVLVMVAVGFALTLPFIHEHCPKLPQWKAIIGVSAAMILYTAVAYFVRPETNGDNLGWLGGSMNDPTQYSDNINRLLWNAHMVLGPGRYTAESLLDACILVGLVEGADPLDPAEFSFSGNSPEEILASSTGQEPPPVYNGGMTNAQPAIKLDSWKYFEQQS